MGNIAGDSQNSQLGEQQPVTVDEVLTSRRKSRLYCPALYPPHLIPTPSYRMGGYAATAAGVVGTPPSAAG